jgi:ABC-type tungstate transport system permease subunit
MKLQKLLPLLFLALLARGGLAAEPAPRSIVLASATSVENSGLLAHILPAFTKERGITVHILAQGTGQALATAARNDVDLALVHDPEAEQKFIAAGDGIDRRQIASCESRRRIMVPRHRRRHGRGAQCGAGHGCLHDQRPRHLVELRQQG